MRTGEIVRLSLVRFATSFLVVLIVGILNRVMIAEFGIGRFLVGAILSFQHLVTPIALYFGFLSDRLPLGGRRRVPYILIGMAMACFAIPLLPDVALGIGRQGSLIVFSAIGVLFLLVFGFGVAVSAIALHALIVDRCEEGARGEAMTIVWVITLVGFIVAAAVFSLVLPTFDLDRLRQLFLFTAIVAFAFTLIGTWRQEPAQTESSRASAQAADSSPAGFFQVLRALASNAHARVLFAFLALADFFFFMQEYVLETFGQEVFWLPVGYTTLFNLYWGAGILISMVGLIALFNLLPRLGEKQVLAIGCVVSSLSFLMLAAASITELEAIILVAIFTMGFGKGIFNVGLARLMMRAARKDLSGLIMGLWAVVGGVAIGLGELGGGLVVDLGFRLTGNTPLSYGILFLFESAGLLLCLVLMKLFDMNAYRLTLDGHLPETG